MVNKCRLANVDSSNYFTFTLYLQELIVQVLIPMLKKLKIHINCLMENNDLLLHLNNNEILPRHNINNDNRQLTNFMQICFSKLMLVTIRFTPIYNEP